MARSAADVGVIDSSVAGVTARIRDGSIPRNAPDKFSSGELWLLLLLLLLLVVLLLRILLLLLRRDLLRLLLLVMLVPRATVRTLVTASVAACYASTAIARWHIVVVIVPSTASPGSHLSSRHVKCVEAVEHGGLGSMRVGCVMGVGRLRSTGCVRSVGSSWRRRGVEAPLTAPDLTTATSH